MRRGRGGRPGRANETAFNRANIIAHQSNSIRRLQKDLKALRDSEIPLFGVTAAPMDNDMFTWRGNIRGPADTKYKGGVFHIQLNFPQNYPVSPPTIKMFTSITHPNVFGQTICLDMLQTNKSEYGGWTSAYTVESILIQLQSFLFEGHDGFINDYTQSKQAKMEVDAANAFRCPLVKHKGPLEPYPKFNEKENDIANFCIIRDPKKILQEELVCFHTRVAIAESSLGIGVSLTRLPRTGEIRTVTPTLGLLSLRAFTKQRVRHDISNEKFSHWLPLYFGESEPFEKKTQYFSEETQQYENKIETIKPKERMVKLLKKSLLFITKGNTRKEFTQDIVLEVMPKLIISHLVELVDDKKHISIAALRRLINFIRLFRMLIDMYPEIDNVINERLEKFIKDPEMRIKDHCSSLGDLLSFIFVSNKYKIEDLLPAYLEEQLDRQAFWIIKTIPELDHTDEKYKGKEVILEDNRNEVCFKTGITGFHMTLVTHALSKFLESKFNKDMDKLCKDLDANFGCLDDASETLLQKQFQQRTKVENFKQYYPCLGLPGKNDQELATRLRRAIDNSKAKRYHGSSDHMNEMPPLDEQAKDYVLKEPSPFSNYNAEKKEFLDAQNPFWKQACIDKFKWVKTALKVDSTMSAAKLAKMSEEENLNVCQKQDQQIKEENDTLLVDLRNQRQKDFNTQQITGQSCLDEYEGMNWRQLFHKLCFEQMIYYFPQLLDFKLMHQYISQIGPEIQNLRIKIITKTALKSNHYWIMNIIGKLTNLKVLKIHKDGDVSFGEDGFKFLTKGLKYLQQNGTKLDKIQINNILGGYSQDYLYSCLKTQPEIKVLKFNHTSLLPGEAKAIGKVLADFKNISELDISYCNLNSSKAKDIADGLMRAKKLEILKFNNNPSISNGADSIIYNLAFSPKIRHIDMSQIVTSSAQTAEAIYKLLKISGAIESLNLSNSGVFRYLTEDFYTALGENKTLNYLNMDHNSYVTQNTTLLGKAIAMNAKRNGSLEALSLRNWFNSWSSFVQFLESMRVSDYDHELWYGDKKIAKEMSKNQLDKTFHCNLKYFNMEFSSILSNYFKLKAYQKQTKPDWPRLLTFTSKNQLDLNLHKCGLQPKDFELFSLCLHENPIGACKIRTLNLSKNIIGGEGSKLLANALEHNTSLKTLDISSCKIGVSGILALKKALANNKGIEELNLYRNIIDVDGARCMKYILEHNSTLKFIDLGHNRLRKTGVRELVNGITANKDSKVTTLGLRSNFINDDGIAHLFENLVFKKSNISKIYLQKNFMSEHYKISLANEVEAKNIPIFVDEFVFVNHLSKQALETSIWVSPVAPHMAMGPDSICKDFMRKEAGLVTDIRIKKGKPVPGRRATNCYAIVEFAHVNSIPRSLKIASKKQARFGGVQCRIYKAGTRTVVNMPTQRKKR